jgi:23S rRNA (cytidine2498-2'-O)-methyltransferase
MHNPLVTFEKGDAFGYGPERVGSLDWLVSDLICYPDKLYEFVVTWLNSGKCKNFICTIKFQGESDPQWIARFRALGGEVMHLSHNKHEVTWVYLGEKAS